MFEYLRVVLPTAIVKCRLGELEDEPVPANSGSHVRLMHCAE